MWAKCHSSRVDVPQGELLKLEFRRADEDRFTAEVLNLLAMIPKEMRLEIEEEHEDYAVAWTTEEINYALLYDKILKKIRDSGLAWK